MGEAGLAETIALAVQAAHPHLHALLYSNILLTGGVGRGACAALTHLLPVRLPTPPPPRPHAPTLAL